MSREVTFDFTGAPPAQGGGTQDHIPPGRYIIRLEEITDGRAKTGKRMVTANFKVAGQMVEGKAVRGEYEGKRLVDRFVLDTEQKFGFQRLHAFLLALKLGVKETTVSVDLDLLINRVCEAQVEDDKIPANDSYAERETSRINAYYAIEQSKNGTAAPTKAAAPKAAAAVVAVVKPEAEAVEVATVAADIDSLFE